MRTLPVTFFVFAGLAAAYNPVKTFGPEGKLTFELRELTGHPLYWWPQTLLNYPVRFAEVKVRPGELSLRSLDTGRPVPFQLSQVKLENGYLGFAVVSFLSDLPSGGARRYELFTAKPPDAALAPLVTERREADTIVVDGGRIRVRLPGSMPVRTEAPGPVMQVSRGGRWLGSSRIVSPKRKVLRIETTREENGPLFICYRVAYELEGNASYIVRLKVVAGYDFVSVKEEARGIERNEGAFWESTWSDFHPTHRHAPNHPFLLRGAESGAAQFDRIPWERIDEGFVNTQHGVSPGVSPEGELPFRLGIYQPWGAYVILTSACFWDERSGDSLGVFIDRVVDWQDHEYAIWAASNTLQVRYYYREGALSWRWPLVTGTRSTGLAAYDHSNDIAALNRIVSFGKLPRLYPATHTQYLQNRFGTVDLDLVKDWILEYPDSARRPGVIFTEGQVRSLAELERRVFDSELGRGMMTSGTRQNAGFSPVPARSFYGSLTDGFQRLLPQMNVEQRRRLTAWYLMLAYVAAEEEWMPMRVMLSGHPNFLSDVKSIPALAAFLFPEHPMAAEWADQFEKFLEMNTRYHTRPAVEQWESKGGRWTENLGTYVWAFLRPAVRAEFALRAFFDGKNRLAIPQIAEICDWALNALSAPFAGEDIAWYRTPDGQIHRHFWGVVTPEQAPRRIHPPQGAHSARRMAPRVLWWLGHSLRNYRPLLAEYLMWAARPGNDDAEHFRDEPDAWRIMYPPGDNRGTNPHLATSKYTGYGIVLRAGVDTPEEVSVHLQQIDEGPNYRWGIAGEGGCGVIYYYAGGKSYSHNGREDVGDRPVHDTDFCSNFGVWKEGRFRSIGRNVLDKPVFDLGDLKFAQVTPRQGRESYSWPEYQSRSVMLAGSEYLVIYDEVFNPAVSHRFSWFTHSADEMPFIHMVKGGIRERQRYFTRVETPEVKGIWYDGQGDAMAVVSHNSSLAVTPESFGCTVQKTTGADYVFLNPEGVAYSKDQVAFSGKIGIIRHKSGRVWEMAVFQGTRVAAGGVALSVDGDGFGASASFAGPGDILGYCFGRNGGRIHVECPACADATLYIDGAPHPRERMIPPGHHRWQVTRGLPAPLPPVILRTENSSGQALVIWQRSAGADRYRIEISEDLGEVWRAVGYSHQTEFKVSGLRNGKKYHVRVTAVNAERSSQPGPEYPIYASAEPPPHPDGLKLSLDAGRVAAEWGEVLGAREYRLYRRAQHQAEFQLVYSGLARKFEERLPGVIKPVERPGIMANALIDRAACTVYQYAVAAVNGNGEGPKSPVLDTDPTRWLHWDPKPGEPFRRRFTYNTSNYLMLGAEERHSRYYPK